MISNSIRQLTESRLFMQTFVEDSKLSLIQRYFELMHTHSRELLPTVFEENCTFQCTINGRILRPETLVYRALIALSDSPQSYGVERKDEILYVDELTSEAGFAKVKIELLDGFTVDYLYLVRTKLGWRISCVFWENPKFNI